MRRIIMCVWLSLVCACQPAPGGGDNGTSTTVTGPRLLVKTWGKVLTFARGAALDGDVAPAAAMVGDKTQLTTYGKIAVTQSNQVITTDGPAGRRTTAAINVYADSTRLGGNQAPARQVAGDQTQLGTATPPAMALDAASDTLYVGVSGFQGGFLAYKILVFDDVSQPGFDGNIPPDRVLRDPDWRGIRAIAVHNNTLYFAEENTVRAYANVGSVDGQITPMPGSIGPGDVAAIFVDPAGRLYVASGFGQSPTKVLRYDSAASISFDSSTQSPPEASATFEMPTGLFPRSITLDSSGAGYVADEGSGASLTGVYIFNNMATGPGATQPDRDLTWLGFSGSPNPPAAVVAID